MSLNFSCAPSDPQLEAVRVDELIHAVDELMLSLVGVGGGSRRISEIAAYHLHAGGGRTRARLALQAALRLSLSKTEATALAAIPELLHNASLVHDDLQDRSPVRRGKPSAWAAYGTDNALLAGDLLISAAYAAIAEYPQPNVVPPLLQRAHQRTAEVISGQAEDLRSVDGVNIPFDDYEVIAAGKSGPLLGLGVELALTAAGFDEAATSAAVASRDLAIAYQITDDLQDDWSDRREGKGQPCLNAVHILRRQHGQSCRAMARQRAKLALKRSRSAASRLPNGAGLALLGVARQLEASLDGEQP